MRKTLTKNQRISDGALPSALQVQIMGYYDDRPPVHAHRTPAELAEDEILAALRGNLRQPFRRVVAALDDKPFEASAATKRREESRTP